MPGAAGRTSARPRPPLPVPRTSRSQNPKPHAANLFVPALLPAARRLRGAGKPQPRSPLTRRPVLVLKRKDQAVARVVETTLLRSSSIPGGHGMVFTEMMPHGWCAQGQGKAPSGTIQLRGTHRLRLSCVVSSRPQRSPRSALDVRKHVQPHGRGGMFKQFWHQQSRSACFEAGAKPGAGIFRGESLNLRQGGIEKHPLHPDELPGTPQSSQTHLYGDVPCNSICLLSVGWGNK